MKEGGWRGEETRRKQDGQTATQMPMPQHLGELGKEKWRDGGREGRQERRESVLLFAFSSPPCEK